MQVELKRLLDCLKSFDFEKGLKEIQMVNIAGWCFLVGFDGVKNKAVCIAQEELKFPAVTFDGRGVYNTLAKFTYLNTKMLVMIPEDMKDKTEDIHLNFAFSVDEGIHLNVNINSKVLKVKDVLIVKDEDFILND